MKLYDSKFVYFDWNEELVGKECFCADTISNLKSFVNYGANIYKSTIKGYGDEEHPFMNKNGACFRFAYYDPSYETNCKIDKNIKLDKISDELIEAVNQRKSIQCRRKGCDYWVTYKPNEHFRFNPLIFEYRLPKQKYIPFENVNELIRAWNIKNKTWDNDLIMPNIWVKNKESNFKSMITGYNYYHVYIGERIFHVDELFNDYEFLDGSIIGKINSNN